MTERLPNPVTLSISDNYGDPELGAMAFIQAALETNSGLDADQQARIVRWAHDRWANIGGD